MKAQILDHLANARGWFRNHLELTFGVATGAILVWIALLAVAGWVGHRYLTNLPADFFTRPHETPVDWHDSRSIWKLTRKVAKNFAGVAIILLGLVLLVLPGPGILAILLGLALVDLPGKRAAQRWFMQRPQVLKLVNSIRAKSGLPPLEF